MGDILAPIGAIFGLVGQGQQASANAAASQAQAEAAQTAAQGQQAVNKPIIDIFNTLLSLYNQYGPTIFSLLGPQYAGLAGAPAADVNALALANFLTPDVISPDIQRQTYQNILQTMTQGMSALNRPDVPNIAGARQDLAEQALQSMMGASIGFGGQSQALRNQNMLQALQIAMNALGAGAGFGGGLTSMLPGQQNQLAALSGQYAGAGANAANALAALSANAGGPMSGIANILSNPSLAASLNKLFPQQSSTPNLGPVPGNPGINPGADPFLPPPAQENPPVEG